MDWARTAFDNHCESTNNYADSGIVMFDGGLIFGFLLIFNGICWKWLCWCISSSVICVVQPCRGLFSHRKTAILLKNMSFDDFQIIFDQNGPNLLLTRGVTIKTGILTPTEFWWVP